MGMSTHVYGFRAPDHTWEAMKAIYDACIAANVPIPDAVDDFFEGEPPDPAGVMVALGEALVPYSKDMEEGFEVQLDKVPSDIRLIRFVNSY